MVYLIFSREFLGKVIVKIIVKNAGKKFVY